MAEEVWKTAVVTIFVILLVGGALDLLLIFTGSESMSDWLTDGRLAWWWWPAGLMLAFIVGMTIHLLTYGNTT